MVLGFGRAISAADRLVGWARNERASELRAERQAAIDVLYARLEHAEGYDEWLESARLLDELEGSFEWKSEPASPHYDSKRIQQQLAEMTRLKAQGEFSAMVYWLRSGIQRNVAGAGNPKLFAHCHVGTKVLIENYNEEILRMLNCVCQCPDKEFSLEQKLNFFTESRHALGKTALLLSGGASLGMYHFGVIKALFLQGLLPRVMSGSSAGAIVLAILGVKTNDELSDLFTGGPENIEQKVSFKFFDFFSSKGSLHRKLKRMLASGVIMDIEKLQEALQHNVGDITFSEAYARTGRIINITVSPGNSFENAQLLNYLTAPNVLVWSAASASCALPGLYESVQLMAKNQAGETVPYHVSNVTWTDGSLEHDLPINRLKELFNVNYLIVSQTNPHAIPFIQREQRPTLRLHKRSQRPGLVRRVVAVVACLLCSEVKMRCHQLVDLGLAPGFLSLLLNQNYVGDVTIVPPLTLEGYLQIISNPSIDSFQRFVKVAERRTWPNLEHIRSQCQVEMVLDDCVRYLAHRAQSRMMASISLRPPQAHDRCEQQSLVAHGRLAADGKPPGGSIHSSPLGIGRPRHTHLDLCQFFSPGDHTGGEVEEEEAAERAPRCGAANVHDLSQCIHGTGGCSFYARGEGEGEGGPGAGRDLGTERRVLFQRKPKSAPRLQHIVPSSADLDLRLNVCGEETRDTEANPAVVGERRGPKAKAWALAGPEEVRGPVRGEEAPALIVKSKSFPFTIASGTVSELECN